MESAGERQVRRSSVCFTRSIQEAYSNRIRVSGTGTTIPGIGVFAALHLPWHVRNPVASLISRFPLLRCDAYDDPLPQMKM